ncbi:MAG: hypothetical protein QG619_2151 [Pseudomonadota bacterium]|nr:hypothetical protein [Pseudomonadota bacterium]
MKNIRSIDEAYGELVLGIKDFVKDRPWDSASYECRMFRKMVQSSHWCISGGVKDTSGLDWPDTSIAVGDAAIFLRDHLLQTTGQRIYGLTFTLTPDGKFTLDYDYERPADYDDSEDTISLEEALGSLAQTDIAGNLANAGDTPERRFLAAAMSRLQTHTAEHTQRWGLGREARWNLDMNTGTLQLSFADGRELAFPVQIVGTYNRQDGTLLWGWDHPSVPEPLRRAARRVREYGEREGFERFTTRTLACTENDAWEFTAAAAELDGVAGAYRGDAGGTWVYMTFDTGAVSGN